MFFNFTQLLFLFLTITVFSGSLLIHTSNGYLSRISKQCLYYGKYSVSNLSKVRPKYEVPKRWFTHFYINAVFVTSIAIILAVSTYFYNYKIPYLIHLSLDLQLGPSRIAVVSPESTMIAITLLNVQSWKRWYETHYVSVFSDSKINLSQYAAGFIHYIGATTCIIGDSYGFVKDSSGHFNWSNLQVSHLICAAIFLIASYGQLRSNFILASLRKNSCGVVVTKSYKIPHGELFEYVSAPLQFTEIIMYLMLTIILWRSSSFHYIFIWVLVNQIETAMSTHRWLQKTFVNYPKHRKIIIPFLI